MSFEKAGFESDKSVEITSTVNSVTKALMHLKQGISGGEALNLAENAQNSGNLEHYKNRDIHHVEVGNIVKVEGNKLKISRNADSENTSSNAVNAPSYFKNYTSAFGKNKPTNQIDLSDGFWEKKETNWNTTNLSVPDSIFSFSEKYESNGDSGAYGYDRVGGHSYGSFQMTKDTARKFAEKMGIFGELGTSKFLQNWRDKVSENPFYFKEQEKNFIVETHLNPQLRKLKRKGVSIDNFDGRVLASIYSTAVQHGPNTNVVIKAYETLGDNPSTEDFLKAIYAERKTRFGNSTVAVQRSVRNRFDRELGELLA